ncbi:MAG: hypothetical protein AB7Q00_13905 [Phycisphaerales bacterium]
MKHSLNDPLSPALDARVIDHHARENVVGLVNDNPVYTGEFTTARGAMATVASAAHHILAAQRTLAASQPGTIDPREDLRLRRAIGNAYEGAQDALDEALRTLGTQRAAIVGKINEEIGVVTSASSVTENARAGETRQYLRSLTPTARSTALREAIREGDAPFVAGALVSPRLAGLSADEARAIRGEAERKFAANSSSRRDAIDALAKRLDTASAAFGQRFADAAGSGDTPAAKHERALVALEGGAA